jgi:hypothetical protein
MQQAHEWRRAMKTNSSADSHVDRIVKRLQGRLTGRDHLFFIDDSSTMCQYAEEILEPFQTLAYIAKGIVSNEIELAFASDPWKIHKRAHTTPLVDILKSHIYTQHPGFMEDSLERLVEVIIERLPQGPPRRRRSFLGKKPISIFVFTDGRWGSDTTAASGVENPILKLMKAITDRNLSRTHVMVQFLRFGEDPVGVQHLNYLDEFGKRKKW